MNKRKKIIKAFSIVIDSVVSHIEYLDKGQRNSTPAWEKKVEFEYLEVAKTLLELL